MQFWRTALALAGALLVTLPASAGVRNWPAGLSVPGRAPIAVDDLTFEPRVVYVAAGSTLEWTNTGRKSQTVTSLAGLMDSGNLKPGDKYVATFHRIGTYHFYSQGQTGGRVGTVIVIPGASGTPGY